MWGEGEGKGVRGERKQGCSMRVNCMNEVRSKEDS